MTDDPLILYDNSLIDQYSMIAGVENSGIPFTEAQAWDALRPWIVTTDVSGNVTVQLDYATAPTVEYICLGAHGHDSGGYRFSGGSVQLEYWNGSAWADCVATASITAATNRPSLHEVSAHTVTVNAGFYSYRLTLSGLSAFADVVLPEFFIGAGLVMPRITGRYDPSEEEWSGPRLVTESGRIYETSLSRRYKASPSFMGITTAKASEINTFRESHLEERNPFWWFYDPLSDPTKGYMMRHEGKSSPMPIGEADYRSIKIKMIEAV